MVPEIIIVVPPLLGLKGNLEMTLAARYDTYCSASSYMHMTVTFTLKDEHGSEPRSNGREGRRNLDNRRKPGEEKRSAAKESPCTAQRLHHHCHDHHDQHHDHDHDEQVLVQCQGIVVGFLASLCGLAMGWLPSGTSSISSLL